MNYKIKYINSFSSFNNNIILFVSNLSQLKRANLPIFVEDFLKNKKFVNRIKTNQIIDINNIKSHFNNYINVKICLIKTRNIHSIKLGNDLYSQFDIDSLSNITFFFSDNLKSYK